MSSLLFCCALGPLASNFSWCGWICDGHALWLGLSIHDPNTALSPSEFYRSNRHGLVCCVELWRSNAHMHSTHARQGDHLHTAQNDIAQIKNRRPLTTFTHYFGCRFTGCRSTRRGPPASVLQQAGLLVNQQPSRGLPCHHPPGDHTKHLVAVLGAIFAGTSAPPVKLSPGYTACMLCSSSSAASTNATSSDSLSFPPLLSAAGTSWCMVLAWRA